MSKITSENRKKICMPVLLATVLSAVCLSGCSAKNSMAGGQESISRSGTYFDTIITITLYDETKESVIDGCFDLAAKYESYFSTTDPSSDIAKINSANCNPVKVHAETKELIEKGLYYSQLTDGRFDITVGKLSKIWQDAIKNSTIPDDSAIKDALSTVDYKGVNISGNKISLSNPHQEIDLGGIAKGYIADKMKEYILSQKVDSALINLGGNVLVVGKKPDGSDFNIGIQEPFSETGNAVTSVKISDKTMVTSGPYERYFESGGHIYHHILDLKTGYPCENDLNSVTIITDSSTDADALSTACFVMGEKGARDFLEKFENIDAVFIDKENNISKTY